MITQKTYSFLGKITYKDGGWVVIDCPHSVVNYYKWWVEKFIGKKISTSYHQPHISVVAGKYDKGCDQHINWKKFDGRKVIVEYEAKIYTDNRWFFKGEYFWLKTFCPQIALVRKSLGLSPSPFHHPHCTIGYCGY